MLIKKEQTETYIITEVAKLDLVRVYVTNFKPGQGKVVIECYGRAWASYWEAMSGKTLQQFFMGAPVDYLFDKLKSYEDDIHEDTLTRIIEAVQKAFRNEFEQASNCQTEKS